MASIRKEILIDESAEAVWAALSDIGALHTRLAPGFVRDTRLEPGARIVTFGNGQVAWELIVDVDDTERRLVWAIVDEPFQHYSAAAQVFSEKKPQQCRFVWIADLLPDELADHVEGMMQRGVDTIKATMENCAATTDKAHGES